MGPYQGLRESEHIHLRQGAPVTKNIRLSVSFELKERQLTIEMDKVNRGKDIQVGLKRGNHLSQGLMIYIKKRVKIKKGTVDIRKG